MQNIAPAASYAQAVTLVYFTAQDIQECTLSVNICCCIFPAHFPKFPVRYFSTGPELILERSIEGLKPIAAVKATARPTLPNYTFRLR